MTGEIALRADRRSPPVDELIPAEHLGESRYRLLRSPGLVEGVAAGDEIEMKDRGEFEIVRRFGNVVVWVFSKDPTLLESLCDRLTPLIKKIGGYLDGGTNFSLIYTIPITAGFGRIETIFKSTVDERLQASWMFANVYGPDGKTPLQWWRDRNLPIFRQS